MASTRDGYVLKPINPDSIRGLSASLLPDETLNEVHRGERHCVLDLGRNVISNSCQFLTFEFCANYPDFLGYIIKLVFYSRVIERGWEIKPTWIVIEVTE